ncbi:hypothetical protein FC98_GL001461 [Lentilactobacillus kisonensis DSM 19906 = JCM 15041]|uniref:Uncharacterized protein n=2 Tax=Lentilactobacillus kisonensis TaxID=481722 RepID=H1LCZ2_9LACO|nr:hypothetical protein HMPREF9104_00456 [Lentilactobacillus kisonensis F0435]KRL20519.1 hypothetical protein FC98_GL001461 [Lentilactobacillus kisonensis DSM 19906 = JCM 15041]
MIYKNVFNKIYNAIFDGFIIALSVQLIVTKKLDLTIVKWIIFFLVLGFAVCFIQLTLSLRKALNRNEQLKENLEGLKQDREKHLEDKKELQRENDDLRFKLCIIYQNSNLRSKSINEGNKDSTNN